MTPYQQMMVRMMHGRTVAEFVRFTEMLAEKHKRETQK